MDFVFAFSCCFAFAMENLLSITKETHPAAVMALQSALFWFLGVSTDTICMRMVLEGNGTCLDISCNR